MAHVDRSTEAHSRQRVLLTGASGYVGGRLLKVLEAHGHQVRCIARRPEYVTPRVAPGTEVVAGDVLDRTSLFSALQGIDCAYYLVHSMGASAGFEERDRAGAGNFAEAARTAGVRRIIYLGGLGREDEELSAHLRSRHEVGRILRTSGVTTVELRASIVLGSGSLSFEMIRSLTERLPAMVMPRWVSVLAQPIGIDDLIEYLVLSIGVHVEDSVVVEVGGAERLSYRDLMVEYAKQRGLKRLMIPVPVLTPKLSSLWLGLVTPLFARIGRKLIDSIKHPTVVTSDLAYRLYDIRPDGAAAAIRKALAGEEREFADTRWSDSLSSAGLEPAAPGVYRLGSRLIDIRSLKVNASPADAFEPIVSIGGKNGLYAHRALWRLRAALDLLLGGVGRRRGRPEHRDLQPGDTLDFWRVEAVEQDKRLRLLAEMKLPGRAWLEFEVTPNDGEAVITQSSIFYPKGLSGLVYWYGLYPLHAFVFKGMLREIGRRASQKERKR
jgi:uncharacterized protein YbjT (DUF2867 family)